MRALGRRLAAVISGVGVFAMCFGATLVATVVVQGGLECEPQCHDGWALAIGAVGLGMSLAVGVVVGKALWGPHDR